MKRIEYLNLKILGKYKRKDNLEIASLICNFDNKFRHTLHSEDKQLNSIADLLVNLRENLEKNNSNKRVENLLENINKNIKILETNLEYLKNQNTKILK